MDLQKRVAGILMNPRQEWALIAAEPDDVASLYRKYILIMAAIPAVAMTLGLMLIGAPLIGRYGILAAISAGVSTYVSNIVAPIIAAVVVEKLAPNFSSTGTTAQALKLVAYSYTPVWVAGVIYVIFFLSPLVIIAGIYSIYLFYLGLPILLKTPLEKVVPFMVVAAIVIIVVSIVLGFVLAALGMPRYGF